MSSEGAAEPAPLPPGQCQLREFPRFGLSKFAKRFPAQPQRIAFEIGGDVAQTLAAEAAFAELPRTEMKADFHCVTSWSVRDCGWSGVRFRDFYERLVVPEAQPLPGAELVVFRGEDGYCSALPLVDVLKDDVLLADHLDGARLGVEHGAPLRLVAPAHYGYKNVKHITRIEFWRDARNYRFPFPYPAFMDHPRARVALEERGRWFPGRLLRYLYRLIVPLQIMIFKAATRGYYKRRGEDPNAQS
ncbi:MAG: molybdopterin-dependent oxidoreductase [Panacagrimonas sp.]